MNSWDVYKRQVKKYAPLCYADGSHAGKHDGSGDFQTQNRQDYVIIRYADVDVYKRQI